ncbi:MAG: hypothetical protein ACRYF3_02870, partial [Janthinobacterium lividum]
LNDALKGFGSMFGATEPGPSSSTPFGPAGASPRPEAEQPVTTFDDVVLEDPAEAVRRARAEAAEASAEAADARPGTGSAPFTT